MLILEVRNFHSKQYNYSKRGAFTYDMDVVMYEEFKPHQKEQS
jgi:hypothetical protein